MQYADNDETQHTDGLLLVDKAQGGNSVYFLSQWKLSDRS